MTIVDFLRHGETETQDALIGRTDPPLTVAGCETVMRQISGCAWTGIVTSSLKRARETAEIAALRLFDGRGAVRLLDADPERGALLLERVEPGTMLGQDWVALARARLMAAEHEEIELTTPAEDAFDDEFAPRESPPDVAPELRDDVRDADVPAAAWQAERPPAPMPTALSTKATTLVVPSSAAAAVPPPSTSSAFSRPGSLPVAIKLVRRVRPISLATLP